MERGDGVPSRVSVAWQLCGEANAVPTIRGMSISLCQCCGQISPIVFNLRRRSAHPAQAWASLKNAPVVATSLCGACSAWLAGVVENVRRNGGAGPTLIGAPVSGGRSLVFGDQCHLCREVVHGAGVIVECKAEVVGASTWQPMFVCLACDGWLSSVANDGRTARGEASRALDGDYGEWLHPNLKGLRVEADIRDEATLSVVRATCAAMGVQLTTAPSPGLAPVLLVEAHLPDRAASRLRREAAARPAQIVLASLAAQEDVRLSLAAGASDWLTIPLTPQQLTAALVRSRRMMHHPRTWDPSSCLQHAFLEGNERPTLRIEPRDGSDAFELAWALRRFSRGYDELATEGGAIILVLRAPAGDVEDIMRRLQQFTGYRAEISLLTPLALGQRRRLEVAG